MIKEKLKELLGFCIDKGLTFNYSSHVHSLTIMKVTNAERGEFEYIVDLYNLLDWNGTEIEHIAKLNDFIEQIKGMN